MKRILIFHNQLWSQYKSCIFESINYKFKNNQLLVIQTSISEGMRKNLVDFDVNSYPYDYPFKLLNNKILEDCNPISTTLSWLYWIIKFRPHIINLTGYSEIGTLPVLLLGKMLGIKTYITNESVLNINNNKKSCKFFYKKLLFRLTTGFYSYGINSNNYLFFHGVPKSKISFFLNSFDKSKFINNNNNNNNAVQKLNFKYILFVGRLSPEKNLDAILELAKYILNNEKDFKIIVIGDGPLKYMFKSKINNLPIIYEGSMSWDYLSKYYEKSLALFLPSNFETWGMVANEAQELGVPVICSKNCGCADDLVVTNYSGFVYEEFNPVEIIKFIEKWKDNQFIKKNVDIFSLERLVLSMGKTFS